jgi:tape measure domain-containing protein
MASRDEVLIRIRMQGGRAAAADVKAAEDRIRGLGRAAPGASRGLGKVGDSARTLGSDALTAAGRLAKLTTAAGILAGTGLAVKAAKTGAAYNKMQDSQMVAFTTMLRSESKARDLMADIQALSMKSPVLDPGSTGQAVQALLNYGMSAERALPLVEALGDASAASGKSITEVMPQAALALGQIEGKGKLQAEELNQITEAVGINRKLLAKELGMTSEEFADAFKPGKGISAEKAIPAIQRALQTGSKGAAKRLSETTAGQMDQLKEVMSRELGDLTRPWYDAAGDTMGSVADILGRGDLSSQQKISMSIDVAEEEFGPLVRDARQAFKDAKVGEALVDGIEEYTPWIIDGTARAVAAAAPKAASMFLHGFTSMGPWGQALTVAFLMKKFHAFGPAGSALGSLMGSRAVKGAGESMVLKSMYMTDPLKAKLGPAGKILGKTMGAGLIAGAAAYIALNNKQISQALGGESKDITTLDGRKVDAMGQVRALQRIKDGNFSESDLATFAAGLRSKGTDEASIAAQMNAYRRKQGYQGRAMGGTTRPGETTLVGERGPEIARFPAGTEIVPNNRIGRNGGGVRARVQTIREQPIQLVVDGKVLYQVISRQTELEELSH